MRRAEELNRQRRTHHQEWRIVRWDKRNKRKKNGGGKEGLCKSGKKEVLLGEGACAGSDKRGEGKEEGRLHEVSKQKEHETRGKDFQRKIQQILPGSSGVLAACGKTRIAVAKRDRESIEAARNSDNERNRISASREFAIGRIIQGEGRIFRGSRKERERKWTGEGVEKGKE